VAGMARRILVWDAPVRLFHWTLAALVVFSFTTGKIGGGWMEWHLKSGYAILALLLFRVAWGFVGSDTARFSSFIRSPRVAIEYLRERLAGRHPAVLGHNPLGGWAVLAMLVVLAFQATTGLFADDEIATQGPLAVKVSNALVSRMSALHSWNQYAILALVALHLVAIGFYRFVWRVRLVPAMIHGHSEIPEGAVPALRRRHPALALALFALACAAVYYLVVIYPRTPA
jgi:cytochrome b